MEVKLYIRMFLRSWWIVAISGLAALGFSLIYSYLSSPTYIASATFVISPTVSFIDQRDVVNSLAALDKRSIISTYAEVLNSNRIYAETLAALKISNESAEAYTYSTIVLPEANIIELSVEGPNPQIVALLANSVGERAIQFISGLYTAYDITFLDTAAAPSTPISPQPISDGTLALALGLAVGGILAVVREQLRLPFEALFQQSNVDRISTAANRKVLVQELEDVLENSPHETSLGIIRLLGLQDIIMSMPQPLAQQILRGVVRTMKSELKGNDVVGRWDDNSFAVVLPNTPGEGAVNVLGRIQVALSKPVKISEDGETLNLLPVTGISEGEKGDSSRVVISRAIQALQTANQEDARLQLFKANPFLNF